MSIDKQDINNIAHLARLQVSDEQAEALKGDVNNILNLVSQLQAADTSNVEPMAHPTDAVQILRKDEVTESDHREQLMAVAPQHEDGLYLVPKVIE